MSDFGNFETMFAEVGGWGVELSLAGEDIKVEAVEVVKLTPASELTCYGLSSQEQENDTQKSFFSEYKKPIIGCVALGAVAIVSILAKMLSGRSK